MPEAVVRPTMRRGDGSRRAGEMTNDDDERAVEAAKARLDSAWSGRARDWKAVEHAVDDLQVALQRLVETRARTADG